LSRQIGNRSSHSLDHCLEVTSTISSDYDNNLLF